MIETAIVIAVAAASIACTIAKATLFVDFRAFATRHSYWGGLLVKCPYCLSHWIAFTGAAIYQPRLVHSGAAVIDVIVTAFAIVYAATILAAAITWLWWGES